MKCTICGKESSNGKTFTVSKGAKNIFRKRFGEEIEDELFMCQECYDKERKSLRPVISIFVCWFECPKLFSNRL